MLCFPNSKINLGLYVTNKRSDGYHDLETVFYPLSATTLSNTYLPLRDVLEIIPGSETKIHLSGLDVAGGAEDNLVWKALQLMRSEFPGRIPMFDIYLHKVMPMGAGLGGGSADGSFMLQLINEHCDLQLTQEELARLALKLGSDCPFFIYNKPVFASGRGEQMSSIPLDLSSYSIQLICPKLHVSTAVAFSSLTPVAAPYDLRQLHLLRIEEWKTYISNDFEKTVFKQYPVLAAIKQQFYEQGAVYTSMSGTGSAIYGIFEKERRAQISIDIPFDDCYLK